MEQSRTTRMFAQLNREKGFTLVELIVMVTITGILSYMALSEFSSTTTILKERTLAKKVVADARYAQEMALSHRQLVKFYVEQSQNRYSLKWADNTYLKTPMAERDFIVDLDEGDFIGINITTTGFASGLLSFTAEGQPLNNGSPLSTETVLMSLDGEVNVKIVPGTGRCYIED